MRVAVNLATGIAGPGTERTMRVVGVTVFPDFGLQDLSDTDLGNGAVVPAALLTTTQANTGCVQGVTCYDFFLLRYRPGTDTAAATTRLLAATATNSNTGFALRTRRRIGGDGLGASRTRGARISASNRPLCIGESQ